MIINHIETLKTKIRKLLSDNYKFSSEANDCTESNIQ